jgi:hypothetical protein
MATSCRAQGQLSPHEERERCAQAGDIDGLFDLLLRSRPGELDLPAVYDQLGRAIETASRGDPAAFTETLFRRLLAFTAYLALRVQYDSSLALAADDAARSGPTRPVSPEFFDQHLARLQQVQQMVGEIAQGWAAAARLWELARRRRREEAPEPKKRLAPSPARRGRNPSLNGDRFRNQRDGSDN